MSLVQIAIIVGSAIMFGGAFTAERNGFEYSQTLRYRVAMYTYIRRQFVCKTMLNCA